MRLYELYENDVNSFGNPIHSSPEGIANFWRWFGKSQVIDDEGRPLVVFHGTGSDFSSFEHQSDGAKALGPGFYFSDSGKHSSSYAKLTGNSNVIPVYLRIVNPIIYVDGGIKKLTMDEISTIVKYSPMLSDHLQKEYNDVSDQAINQLLSDYNETNKQDMVWCLTDIHGDLYPDNTAMFLKLVNKVTGYDGIYFPDRGYYVAWMPNQIKSIHNFGTFSDNSSKIVETP